MTLSEKVDKFHFTIRRYTWLVYFSILLRIALAWGFLPSGFVKIMGERFTSLSNNHPMGAYLTALHKTGFYYTSIGILQILAAILLLIPRTVLLGALIYLPIILNIAILSISVRFEGSLVSSPLMVCAVLFLIFWEYHKWKNILPFNHKKVVLELPVKEQQTKKIPWSIFGGIFTATIIIVLLVTQGFAIYPRNTTKDCLLQCEDSSNPQACIEFCNCIHQNGKPLQECLDAYKKAMQKK